jgi:hypothetical protein
MTPDKITTLSAVIAAISGLVVTVFPGPLGDMLKIVIGGIGAAALAILGYYANKGTNTPV